MRKRGWLLGGALAWALALGCESGAPGLGTTASGPAYEIHDSAGIMIVENRWPSWGEGEGWRVEETPEVVIGGATDDPAQQLWQVRGGLFRADGSVVLANGGSNELRWYDASGTLVRSVGGAGEGPGEFRLVTPPFALSGDSIAVADYALRRISVYEHDLEFVGSHQYAGEFSENPVARFLDGTYLMVTTSYALGGRGATRVERTTMRIERLREDGRVATVAELPFTEHVIGPTGITNRDGSPQIAQNPRAFGRSTWVVADGGMWVAGDNARPELQYRSPNGELTRLVRWDLPPRRVTAEDIERNTEATLERYQDPERRRGVREAMKGWPPPPETMPAFGRSWRVDLGEPLMLDDKRNLWVKEYTPVAEEWLNEYMVFDSLGIWLGTVSVPPGVLARSVSHGRLVGVVRDELDVETVVVHRVVEGAR